MGNRLEFREKLGGILKMAGEQGEGLLWMRLRSFLRKIIYRRSR